MCGRMCIFLLTAILLLASLPLDVSGDMNYFEDNFVYGGGGVIYLQDSAYFDGYDASDMRKMYDAFGNSDGYLSQDDLDAYNSFITSMDIYGRTSLYKLDGGYGAIENLASEFENAEGPVNSTESWKLISHRRFHFEESSQVFHTFSFAYVTLGPIYDTHSNFTFKVPSSWKITNCTGLEEMSISSDGKIVEGLAPFNQDIKVRFKKIGAIDMVPIYIGLLIFLLIGGPLLAIYAKYKLDQRKTDNEEKRRPECLKSFQANQYKCTVCRFMEECENNGPENLNSQ
ncbi:MAG: hypothetical protein Q7J68_04255 [Thermoplasmata archaeon]|nr:hypothetical protein [Thermoplasmata archaeon]